MLHKKMRWQVCYLFACVVLYSNCSSTYQRYRQEQEEKYYTENTYAILPYSQKELQDLWYIKDQNELALFIEKLNEKFAQWNQGGVPQPIALWQAYRKECLMPFGYNVKESQVLWDYYTAFERLLEKPSDIIRQQELKKAHQALQFDLKAQNILRQWAMNIYHNLDKLTISKSLLVYKAFLNFILNDNTTLLFYVNIQTLSHLLKKWQDDQHKSGMALWQDILNREQQALAQSKLFQYQENQNAVYKFLKLLEEKTKDPNGLYTLSCKDLQETIPHGRKVLYGILHELDKETQDIKLLKTYCGFIDL